MFKGTNLQKYKILEQNFRTVTIPMFSKQCIFSFQADLSKCNHIVIGIKMNIKYVKCHFSAVNAYQKTEGHTLLYEKVYSSA